MPLNVYAGLTISVMDYIIWIPRGGNLGLRGPKVSITKTTTVTKTRTVTKTTTVTKTRTPTTKGAQNLKNGRLESSVKAKVPTVAF
jgi:hypothetical protein